MPVLTAIDVLGIQSYIFASNRLRDVVGASSLVDLTTRKDEELLAPPGIFPTPEIIVAAGGNAVLRFDTKVDARNYVAGYTRRVLKRAPGLDVAIAHFEYETGQLARGLLALQVKLEKAKLDRRPQAPQLGLSVMAPCAVTGLPASTWSKKEDAWVSSRIARIREQVANSGWDQFLPNDVHGRGARFPDELDQLGRSHGDMSMIGVVHVDGNGIGRRIRRWLVGKLEDDSAPDEAVIKEYAQWSRALDDLGKDVFRAVVQRVANRIDPLEDGFAVRGQPSPRLDFSLGTDTDGTIRLPLRPILLGGDDLTFVCDGRIALDLAASALREFTTKSMDVPDLKLLGDEPVTACAGVAIVNAHAPFSRSYQLCEDLCANAKRAREVEPSRTGDNNGCWIDWQVGTVRPDESVNEVRGRQYQEEKLTCRPYPLHGDAERRLTWDWLDREMLGEPSKKGGGGLSFRNPDVWGERRNKVKELARLIVEGGNAVQKQLDAWKSVFPEIDLPREISPNGFKGDKSPLLDAIELLDLHLRLDTPPELYTTRQEAVEVSL